MSCSNVAKVLFLDDDTIRTWYRLYQEDGFDGLATFGYDGSACRLNDQQQDKLKAWITETGATGAWVEKELGISSESRSGMVALLHRLGMEHRKPKRCRASWTPTSRPPLSSSTKTYRTRLAIMKPCCSAMRCIRRMRCGRWDAGHLRICRSERPRAAAASGETGQTRMIGAATVNAVSMIMLPREIEAIYPGFAVVRQTAGVSETSQWFTLDRFGACA
jgi:transposase